MAVRSISEFADAGVGYAPANVLPLVDLSLGAADAANKRVSVANLFDDLARNTTEGGLTLGGRSSMTVAPLGKGRLWFDAAANKWKASENGSAFRDLLARLSGTANQVLVNGGTAEQSGVMTLSLPSLIVTPQAQFGRTTTEAGAELTVTKTLNNSIATSDVVSLNSFTFNDASTANRLSAQMLRFVYYRTPTATGQATAFDSMIDLIPVLDGNVPHAFNALSIEPNLGAGVMTSYTRIRLFGGGNATFKYGFVAEPNSGNNGFGVAAPVAQVDVKSDSPSKVAAIFSSASTPSVNIVEVQVNGAFRSGFDSSARLRYDSALVSTSVGAAGGASALPATPTGYLLVNVGGTQFKVPYFAS